MHLILRVPYESSTALILVEGIDLWGEGPSCQELEDIIVCGNVLHRRAVMHIGDLLIRANDEQGRHSPSLEDLEILSICIRHVFLGVQEQWIGIFDDSLVKFLPRVFFCHEHAQDLGI